jgi:hypothetical protein
LDGNDLGGIVVACGFGVDAEYLSSQSFNVTAFDVAQIAVRAAQERHQGLPGALRQRRPARVPRRMGEASSFVPESPTVQSLSDEPPWQ